MNKTSFVFFICISIISVIFIILLATGFFQNLSYNKADEFTDPIIITPGRAGAFYASGQIGQTLQDESLNTKIPMNDGETVIAVLNRETEDGFAEEQFVAFLPPPSVERRINVTYINYSPAERQYKRLWDAETAAVRPDTITMSSLDLIGDRNNCIIITGMNMRNEHTMTILRRNPNLPITVPFAKIAEIQIDGSIIIQETVRSAAYHQGITTGASFTIAAYGQDTLSNNILDQIETIYSFNPSTGNFEQTRISRIPGSQIEQRLIRELLSGTPGVFEDFITDLWYFVSPEGTIDSKQYIYFDPQKREIIFYGDDAQQIFHWQSSRYTRYGLYIRSQNISLSTLLRFIDIELLSLDSVRLRVVEDVRIRITAQTTWDGIYRRAKITEQQDRTSSVRQSINAQYDSTWGRIHFHASGKYTISSASLANPTARNGHYVFFNVNGQELLELYPEEGAQTRMVYRVDPISNGISLSRVRLGTGGVQDLYEPPVILTLVE